MCSKSLDDLTINELSVLPKWAVPLRFPKKLGDALAAEKRDRIKNADAGVAPEIFHY
jgi:hypothetical protein